MADLGLYLKKLRGKRSLRELAKATGISHTYLSTLEKGFDPRSYIVEKKLYTRHKTDVTNWFPELLTLDIPKGTVLNGEVVMTDTDGKPDFEDEMPEDYEKGNSKSFAAYEYLKEKRLENLPHRLLNIVIFVYNIPLDEELNHDNENILMYYNWDVLDEAIEEWSPEVDENYIITVR
ncbi:hypothetical protein [Bacillus paramycoides]|uniref:helix-turn-helix domain-containing protein n=1 Tax=Bacillus paramycoides TaxID=2026194 RepID=UPI002E23223C